MGKGLISDGGDGGYYSVTVIHPDNVNDYTKEAYCADYTENLTGDVGLIEIPNEPHIGNIGGGMPSPKVIIRPGYSGRAVYTESRDGILKAPTESISPYAFYYNLAIMPGFQKWKPTYRKGIISDIDRETGIAAVSVSNIPSSQQAIFVNQGVVSCAIEYMECDHAAFQTGDAVVVEFTGQDWAAQKIIGFYDKPLPCPIIITLIRDGDNVPIDEVELDHWEVVTSAKTLVPKSGYTAEYIGDSDDWDEGTWRLRINDEYLDENGYFISYKCKLSVWTQYPFRYKGDEWYLYPADLIGPGVYEDHVPYWVNQRIDQGYGTTGWLWCVPGATGGVKVGGDFSNGYAPGYGRVHEYNSTDRYKLKNFVRSSVPFRSHEQWRGYNWLPNNRVKHKPFGATVLCTSDNGVIFSAYDSNGTHVGDVEYPAFGALQTTLSYDANYDAGGGLYGPELEFGLKTITGSGGQYCYVADGVLQFNVYYNY